MIRQGKLLYHSLYFFGGEMSCDGAFGGQLTFYSVEKGVKKMVCKKNRQMSVGMEHLPEGEF